MLNTLSEEQKRNLQTTLSTINRSPNSETNAMLLQEIARNLGIAAPTAHPGMAPAYPRPFVPAGPGLGMSAGQQMYYPPPRPAPSPFPYSSSPPIHQPTPSSNFSSMSPPGYAPVQYRPIGMPMVQPQVSNNNQIINPIKDQHPGATPYGPQQLGEQARNDPQQLYMHPQSQSQYQFGAQQMPQGYSPAMYEYRPPPVPAVSLPMYTTGAMSEQAPRVATTPPPPAKEEPQKPKEIVIADDLDHVWSGFITRGKQNRVGVDAYLLQGDVAEFFTDYNLNISHRTTLEELAKLGPAILGVVVFTSQNETQTALFASYLDYFAKKERVWSIRIFSL